MSRFTHKKSILMLGVGLLFGLMIGVGMMVGVIVAMQQFTGTVAGQESLEIPTVQQMLHATTASNGKSMAMATGNVFEDAEGIFILDFLTGDLHCWVPNARNLKAGYLAVYKANVVEALGVEKGKPADYVLVTGTANASGRSGQSTPAGCVCYVGDSNSGKVAAYSCLFDRTAAKAGRLQTGELILLTVAPARPEVELEQ